MKYFLQNRNIRYYFHTLQNKTLIQSFNTTNTQEEENRARKKHQIKILVVTMLKFGDLF